MKKIINGKLCNTESAKQIAFKFAGEFGDVHGYEERLFITKTKQHFLYGTGGSDSPYPKPLIKLLTSKQAKEWEKEAKKE
jgi:hypothetical protein